MPLDHKIVTLLIHYLYKNVGVLNICHFLIRNPDKHASEVSSGFLKKPSKTLTVAPTNKTTSAIKAYPLMACPFSVHILWPPAYHTTHLVFKPMYLGT